MTRRMIAEDTWEDDVFASLSFVERLIWIGMITACADDQGRFQDNANLIKSKIFPLDDFDLSIIKAILEKLAVAHKIIRYCDGSKKVVQIISWWKHQTPQWAGHSNLPAPDGWIDRERYHGKENKIVLTNWGLQGGFPTNYAVSCQPLSPSNDVKGDVKGDDDVNGDGEDEVLPPRPNIFSVYEHEIGMLTPIISDELILAEKDYPEGWVALALKESALNNKRSWSYAKAILKRCSAEGRPPGSKETVPKTDTFLAALEKAESNGN